MKKVKLYPTLALSFILSSLAVTSSALEETFTYGTRPTTWSGVPITGAGDALRTGGSSNGGSSYTPPEARAAIAAQQKAAYEGQKAYCKANNYPTNVPFCAGFKEQERQQCKATEATRNHAAQGVKNECVRRHTYNATAQKNQCPQVTQATIQSTVTINTPVVNGTANGSQVFTPRDTCRQQIDDQLDLDKIGCNNDYHDATPPMNCDSI